MSHCIWVPSGHGAVAGIARDWITNREALARLPLQSLVVNKVESSIAVEDAVENRSLYRVFVSRLFSRGLRHYGATIARLRGPLSGLEQGG